MSKTFTLAGLGATEQGILGYGSGSASLTPAQASYNVMVEPGTYDWLAAFGPAPSFPNLAFNWTAYRIGRGETAPGGTVAINRTGASAFASVPFTVTGGASGSFYAFLQSLEGARGPIIGLPLGDPVASTGSGNMLFLAPGDRLPTDMNSLTAINIEQTSTVQSSRASVRYFGSAPPASINFALPAAVPAFTVTPVNGAPVPTWTVSGSIPAEYQTTTSSVEVSVQGAGESTLYTVSATRGWLTANNMSTTYTLTAPTLPGFLTQWAPAAPLVDAQVVMFGSNITNAPVAGSILNFAIRLVSPP